MIKFGTGGWREIIGDQFTKKNVQLIAAAIAMMMKEEGATEAGFCIGYDRRFLSKEAAQWVAEVMAYEHISCYFIKGAAPTPLIMYTVQHKNMKYGLSITASHNPHLYNGIKVFTEGGRDANEVVTQKIERNITKIGDVVVASIPFEDALEQGLVQYGTMFNEYIDDILNRVDVETIKNARLRVVLDPMYGVSQTSLRTILATTRCDLSVIHDRHDTLFGGKLPTPTSESLNKLRDFLLEIHADIGIATDGDADRIGVIDDSGAFLHPNHLLVLLYYYLMEYKGWRGDVVRNVSTTHVLDAVAHAYGQTCHEVNVGFKHISSKMSETDAIIGGESSGGLTIRGHINGKDGIYAAAILVEMIAVTGKKLSQLSLEANDRFGRLYMEENDVRMTPHRKEQLMQRLMIDKDLPESPDNKGIALDRVSYADGCKLYFKQGGWLIIRFSGTEPLLRICCEMESQEEVAVAMHWVSDWLQL